MKKILLIVITSLVLKSLLGGATQNRVVFYNVDQGDSSMIQYSGRTIFIDGGPADNIVYRLENALDEAIKIDLFILTHFHSDHYSGVYDLVERYQVDQIYMPGVCEEDLLLDDLVEGGLTRIDPGQFIHTNIGGSTLTFGVPLISEGDCIGSDNYNNASIVTYFYSPNSSILLMGDAEKETEEVLFNSLEQWEIGEVDILKAGHHCSKTSSSRVFLEIVKPKMVICSAGEENRFGHPSNEVIDRLEELNIDYKITWENGDLEFTL